MYDRLQGEGRPSPSEGEGLLSGDEPPVRPSPHHFGQPLHGDGLHLPDRPLGGMAGDPQPHAAQCLWAGTGLPQSSLRGSCARAGRGYGLLFQHEGEGRTLHAHMDRFRDGQALDAQILLTQEPEESIVMCTPFEKPGQFYFNQKINCMRAQGKVTLGDREYVFDPEDSFAVLDWGRGVWTCRGTWYWGSASRHGGRGPIRLQHRIRLRGHLRRHGERPVLWRETPQALPGDLPYPTEERTGALPGPLDLRQRRPALSDEVPPHPGPAACPSAGVVRSGQHQVFGSFTGTAVLDDGTAVRLKELLGFAEKVDDRW